MEIPDPGCCTGDRDCCIPISTSTTMTKRAMWVIIALRWGGDLTPFCTVEASFVRICQIFAVI